MSKQKGKMATKVQCGGFIVTICCEKMESAVKWYAVPVHHQGEDVLLVESAGYEDLVLHARYCWHCGKKIEMRKATPRKYGHQSLPA